jgi:hypothetical protein
MKYFSLHHLQKLKKNATNKTQKLKIKCAILAKISYTENQSDENKYLFPDMESALI